MILMSVFIINAKHHAIVTQKIVIVVFGALIILVMRRYIHVKF